MFLKGSFEMYKVLLVEDDPGIGKTVEFNLLDEGYEVRWSKNLKIPA